MPLRDLQPFDRPRERLVREGPQCLTDAELLALLIGAGGRSRDASDIAAGLLHGFPDLRAMASATVAQLADVPGVGHVQACRLKAALALAGRLGERPFTRGDPVLEASNVFERMGRLRDIDHEELVVLALDGQARVLSELCLSRGGACSVDFRPHDLFRALIGVGARSAILVHNHPSGDPQPSPTDVETTARLKAAGDLLGVLILDHVIVGHNDYWSYVEAMEGSKPPVE